MKIIRNQDRVHLLSIMTAILYKPSIPSRIKEYVSLATDILEEIEKREIESYVSKLPDVSV